MIANALGSEKVPISYTRRPENFVVAAEALNIGDGTASAHVTRLRGFGWGFNLLRLPCTWETLEREGPWVCLNFCSFSGCNPYCMFDW